MDRELRASHQARAAVGIKEKKRGKKGGEGEKKKKKNQEHTKALREMSVHL